tara:strand:- start:2494 stop:3108 length:615 start_codon:yes stop_codon:yes gene_type:complete
MINYYKILNIDNNATNKEIKNSYKKLVLKYHPDKNNGKDYGNKFELITNAYHTLMDPYTRGKYDQKLEHYNNSMNCNYISPLGINLFERESFMDSKFNDFINLTINESYDSKFKNMFDNAFSMVSDIKNNNIKDNSHFVSSGSFYSSKIDNNGDKKVTKKMYRNMNGKKDNYEHEYIEKQDGSKINEKEYGNKNLFKKKYTIKN